MRLRSPHAVWICGFRCGKHVNYAVLLLPGFHPFPSWSPSFQHIFILQTARQAPLLASISGMTSKISSNTIQQLKEIKRRTHSRPRRHFHLHGSSSHIFTRRFVSHQSSPRNSPVFRPPHTAHMVPARKCCMAACSKYQRHSPWPLDNPSATSDSADAAEYRTSESWLKEVVEIARVEVPASFSFLARRASWQQGEEVADPVARRHRALWWEVEESIQQCQTFCCYWMGYYPCWWDCRCRSGSVRWRYIVRSLLNLHIQMYQAIRKLFIHTQALSWQLW